MAPGEHSCPMNDLDLLACGFADGGKHRVQSAVDQIGSAHA